jgi:hypothetical protein
MKTLRVNSNLQISNPDQYRKANWGIHNPNNGIYSRKGAKCAPGRRSQVCFGGGGKKIKFLWESTIDPIRYKTSV